MITFFLLLCYILRFSFFFHSHKIRQNSTKCWLWTQKHTQIIVPIAISRGITSTTTTQISKRWDEMKSCYDAKQSKKKPFARAVSVGLNDALIHCFVGTTTGSGQQNTSNKRFQNRKCEFNSLINFWQICGRNLCALHYKIINL